MSRTEKFKNRNKTPASLKSRREKSERSVEDQQDVTIPSRRIKHPSNKQQMTKLFYNFLIVLFVSLVVGLLLYGQNKLQ
ncbi:hypothetical protein [Paenibacillus abyssi]|uniref:Uncharacterized protein n=1 Tax=Paenibacillus abyssi TaxID=1340531 RepID=A0A917CGD3_9BACL|nr:hypothetical protein [Paenibacillus abyssi]GGF87686.1 hypothetical protein GCM10010916_01240 [Paenibacillus abyssi]